MENVTGCLRILPRILSPAARYVVLAAIFAAAESWSAPGDLDPAFGEVGRLGPIQEFDGIAWSLEPGDDQFIVSGGDYHLPIPPLLSSDAANFVGRIARDGTIDSGFSAPPPADTQIQDVAVRSDGKIVAVGRRMISSFLGYSSRPVILRLEPDGAQDSDVRGRWNHRHR